MKNSRLSVVAIETRMRRWVGSDSPRSISAGSLLVTLIVFSLAAYGISKRSIDYHRLAKWTEAQSIRSVELTTLRMGGIDEEFTLPGEVRALNIAKIRARVSGYVKAWRFDIGARVNARETLAVIDVPELNQQYLEAKGQLEKAQAQAQLARLTSKRWSALRGSTVVSQQSVDEKTGMASAKEAEVTIAQGNLNRLKVLKGFAEVTAPFSGVVTSRRVDVGMLVGPSDPAAMFDLTDTHQLRVYVGVPQWLSSEITPGMRAHLVLPQYPDRAFDAKVIATSRAIGKDRKTLEVQLLVDNEQGAIAPGSFAEVRFLPQPIRNVVRIPATAILLRGGQQLVAIVGDDRRILLKKLTLRRDFGSFIDVSSGISRTDRVVNFPSEDIQDGDDVIVEKGSEKDGGKGTWSAQDGGE
jgi:RND family efflux transporter MFP subunit